MKQINLNPISDNLLSNERIDIDEFEFWMYYFTLINIKRQIMTTARLVEVMATVMTDLDNGEGELFTTISLKDTSKALKTNHTNLSIYLKKLAEVGVLSRTETRTKRNVKKYIYYVEKNLLSLKNYINSDNKHLIDFNFLFKIEK